MGTPLYIFKECINLLKRELEDDSFHEYLFKNLIKKIKIFGSRVAVIEVADGATSMMLQTHIDAD